MNAITPIRPTDTPPDAHIAKALTLLRAMSWGASKYRPKLDIINDVHRCCDEAIAELQAALRETPHA